MTTPNKLRCVNGKIVMDDGSDPTEYLKMWCSKACVGKDDPINIVRHDSYVNLKELSELAFSWGA